MVLVHGHPFNRTLWTPQVRALAAAGYRVVTPDLRGYGDSDVVPGRTPLSDFADDIAALLDTLGLERVVIGGVSMGNARSLRAFFAAGFIPIGSEVLLRPERP